MRKYFIKENFTQVAFYLFIFIYVCFYFRSYSYNYENSYSFSELFLNYEGGFVRRGFLGQVFLYFYSFFQISPIIFFSSIFFFIHILNILLLFKIVENTNYPLEIKILILFSPALLLFPIYDYNMFFIKDAFIKFLILFHAYIIIVTKNNLDKYLIYLKFLVIPLIFFTNILIHEYGIFFIFVHFLFSLCAYQLKKKFFLIIYFFLFLSIFCIVFYFKGNLDIFNQINFSINEFNIKIHSQLAGGFKSLIGGFYKWHFFYFSYRDFLMLITSFFLSVWIFFFIFQNFINKNIINYKLKINYLLFFLPSVLNFLNLDHGRNLSLLSFHLVAFYLILDEKSLKLKIYLKSIKNNFFLMNIIYIFIFIYIFMWILPQDAGFGGKDQSNTIFKSSLFSQFLIFIKYIYLFINENIFSLPDIKL